MVQNLRAILSLTKEICSQNENIFFLLTSKLNQDPLENFFSQVRSRLSNNNNPTLSEFNSIIAKLTTLKLITAHSINSNCENDLINEVINTENISNDIYVVKDGNTEIDQSSEIDYDCCDFDDNESVLSDCKDDDNDQYDIPLDITKNNIVEINSMKYVSGYAVFKLLNKIKCEKCKEIMTKDDVNYELNTEWFLFYKNYSNEKFNLKIPSDLLFRVCQLNIHIFYTNFKKYSLESNIKKKIVQLCIDETNKISEFSDWFSSNGECFEHRHYILSFLILILLRKHSKWWTEKIISKEKISKTKKKMLKTAKKLTLLSHKF